MGHRDSIHFFNYSLMSFDPHLCSVYAMIFVPPISVGVRLFGRFVRELSHKTQAAAAAASSIAEVCSRLLDRC